MPITLAILLSMIIICLILLVRNELVFRVRQKALKIISKKAKIAIKNNENWEKSYTEYDLNDSYDKMFFDLTKWSFNQFYPNINKKK